MIKPVRFVQLSDTHVCAEQQATLLGVPTYASLDAVVTMLQQHREDYDFIIHSGDLSQDYSLRSYQDVATCIDRLEKPIYFVPGNHDDPFIMAQVFPVGHWLQDKQIVCEHWQIILLNSQKRKSVEGYLDEEQLAYLDACVCQYPDKHALVVFHHHPVPVGAAWLDRLGVENAEQFWQQVSRYPSVKAVFFGHVHQEHVCTVGHIQCYSVPSTCIQFKRHQDAFGLAPLPPGCRVASLHADGSIETQILRVNHYIGHFDEKATGY